MTRFEDLQAVHCMEQFRLYEDTPAAAAARASLGNTGSVWCSLTPGHDSDHAAHDLHDTSARLLVAWPRQKEHQS